MRPSLFPSDESLPTWLHEALLLLGTSLVWGYFLWRGIPAIFTGHIEPMTAGDGEYLFGPKALDGSAAKFAGFALVCFAASTLAMAFRFSRFAGESFLGKALPWCLFVAGWLFLHYARH